MRLVSFRIQNFKSIIDTGDCHLSEKDNILVLAGQNEAGKSAAIEALAFFGNGASKNFNRLQKRQDTHPQVICNFSLDESEIKGLSKLIKDKDSKKLLKKLKVISLVRGNLEKDSFKSIHLTEESKELLKDLFLQGANEQKIDDSPLDVQTETPQNAGVSQEGVEQPTTEQPVEAEEVVEEKLEPEIEEEFIESIKGLETHLVGLMRKFVFFDTFSALLPGEVKIIDIEKYPAVSDFQKVFKVNFTEVAKNPDGRARSRVTLRLNTDASDDLNKYWTQKLEENGKYNFNVNIVPQKNLDDSWIEFKVDREDGDPLWIEQKSKGFQWFSAFNLRLRSLGTDLDTIKNLIILIDEPGQGLHEKAQSDVKRVIEELGEKGAQIIYTTHYPNLIGTEGREFARIRIVSNTKEEGTKVETVAQFASRSGQGAQDALSPLITAMGIHSVGSLLDTHRLNVVVEGISDHYYLTAFKKLLNKDERLYFLPACGVTNVPNLVSVLIGWGCNYKAVFDDDQGSGRTAYRLLRDNFYEGKDDLAHEHILKIKDCNGIEDVFTKTDFYKYVLSQAVPSGPKDRNSEVAEGRKEALARLFLERVETDEIRLGAMTIKKISEIFDWLYEKFGITTSIRT